ncbi:aarF domain-containing protein kinase 1-like [Bolinopsis microptera]|uniref:aarF domain-containing protein kinase 1-like n=1 Tax=Bolinopsis microptera TaxID=2820187 RepID=UPI0030790183
MRQLLLKTLHHIRKNKVRTGFIGGTACIIIYGYNAKVSPVKVATALVRTGRAGGYVLKAASLYKYRTWGVAEDDKETMSEIHKKTAEAICDLCSVNGGLFIKVGQHIGTLDYLLPKEYVQAFKILHAGAPESSLDSVKKVVAAELGAKLEDVFSEFDPSPIGSASLAQVHRAVLRSSNKEVAVKVQHSTVHEHSKIDTVVIEFLAKLMDKVFPEFEFDWLIDTIKRNLPKELDFVQEGQNCEHVSMLFNDTPFMKVPKIYWEFTSRRVLCMEYIVGGMVDDAEYMKANGINKSEVLGYLSKIFSQMIFERGYIHCDPHPGNVMVQKVEGKTCLVLLDHGLYQTLTDDFRINYCKLWQALLKGDTERIKKQAQRLGVGKYYGLFACMVASRTWDDITGSGITDKNSNLDVNRLQEEAVRQIPEISQVLNYIPRQLILILKTNDLLRGIECSLLNRNTQGVGTFLNMARYCLSALTTHKLHKSTSLRRTAVIYYTYTVCMVKLRLLRFLYWVSLTRVGGYCEKFLPSHVAF